MILKRNIIANFAGQGWQILLGLLVVPFYVKLMGIEGYGLVGFYLTLQAVFNSFLDFGLSVTITREIARYSVSPDKINRTRDLVRTLEIGYWLIGLLLGLAVILGAPFIANNWLSAENISPDLIRQIVIAMGIATIFQWPLTFYQGGLYGLQKIVALNVITIGFTTLRSVGAVLLLWLFSPSAMTFFQWQILSILLQVITIALVLWRNLPASDHSPRFDYSLLVSIWRFAFGMSATSFVTFFLTSADRIILSKVLPLEFFGYYSLGTTLSAGLQSIGSQIMRVLFPDFSALVAKGDEGELRKLYHKSAQLVTVIILPATIIAVLFSVELIQLWTQDANTTLNTAPIAAMLFIGSAINTLLSVPHYLVLAYGWTSLGFFTNLISLFLIVPLMIVLSLRWGGLGAASTWVILNSGYLLITPSIIHRRILKRRIETLVFSRYRPAFGCQPCGCRYRTYVDTIHTACRAVHHSYILRRLLHVRSSCFCCT